MKKMQLNFEASDDLKFYYLWTKLAILVHNATMDVLRGSFGAANHQNIFFCFFSTDSYSEG